MNLNGYFEQEGKNPALGAFLLISIIGGLYFLTQVIFQQVIVFVGMLNSEYGTNPLELTSLVLGDYKSVLLLGISACQFIFFIFISSKVIKKWHTGDIIEYIQTKLPPVTLIVAAVFGAIGILPLVFFIAELTAQWFPGMELMEAQSAQLLTANNSIELGIVFFAISFTPAICEEFIFRGYFQRTFSRKFPGIVPVIISGIFFALFHLSPFNYIALSFVGIFLSFLYFVGKSIWPGVIAHALYNGILIGLQNNLIPQEILLDAKEDIKLEGYSLLLLLFIAVGLLLYQYKKNNSLQRDSL